MVYVIRGLGIKDTGGGREAFSWPQWGVLMTEDIYKVSGSVGMEAEGGSRERVKGAEGGSRD